MGYYGRINLFPRLKIPELSEVPAVMPGAGQIITVRVLPDARTSAGRISVFLVHSALLFSKYSSDMK